MVCSFMFHVPIRFVSVIAVSKLLSLSQEVNIEITESRSKILNFVVFFI